MSRWAITLELHNANPLIFGERVLYSNCGQGANPGLKHLGDGSVIAFGSGEKIKGERRWMLDTVLEVKNSIEYHASEGGEVLDEEILKGLGVKNAIVRPILVYGNGDLLLNNMVWALRRFPVFPVYGKGDYPVQPVYAEDVAVQTVEAGSQSENTVADAEGSKTFFFKELLRLMASAIGIHARLVRTPSSVSLALIQLVGLAQGRPLAHKRRGCRTHGGPADLLGRADRYRLAERLARRQRRRPGE